MHGIPAYAVFVDEFGTEQGKRISCEVDFEKGRMSFRPPLELRAETSGHMAVAVFDRDTEKLLWRSDWVNLAAAAIVRLE